MRDVPINLLGLAALGRKPKPVASRLPRLVDAAASGWLKPAMKPLSMSLALPLSAEALFLRRLDELEGPSPLGKGMGRDAGEVLAESGGAS